MLPPPLQVRVYFDFASTLSYVAHHAMERLGADLVVLEIALDWRPIDLTRITGWPRGAVVTGPRRDKVERVAAALGVPVSMPARWLDSRPASAIALALAGTPQEPAWREQVWRAAFEAGCDIGDAAEIRRLAAAIGVDASAGTSPEALARVDAETRTAYEAQVNGVPTFMLGRWPLSGIQEDDTMRAHFARWARKERGMAVQ